MSTLQVCVAQMRALLGMVTWMPCVVGVLAVQGVLVRRKWPVHPVSAMAVVMVAEWAEVLDCRAWWLIKLL
jgi:hypothetical protein